MSTHCVFKLEGRRYGSGHATYAQIVCGYCDHAEWHIARDSGVAIRVFRSAGWKVGNKPNQHRCPACFSKIRIATRTPDNPAIPKEIGKQLKEKILNDHLRETLLGDTALTPKGRNAMPRLPDDDRPPEEKALDGIHPVFQGVKAVRGQPPEPGRTVFTSRHSASSSGTRATGTTDGHAFYTVPLGKGWTWKLTVNTTEAERSHWRSTRKYGARHMKARAEVAQSLAPIPAAPPPINLNAQPPKDPMQHTILPELVADPARQPTRDERSTIHDELTQHYNIVDQRYDGNGSDASLASRLNLPRAWITNVREMFFGDHDRNASSEKKKLAITEALALATAASKRLLEMASEAETIERGLLDALNKLEG